LRNWWRTKTEVQHVQAGRTLLSHFARLVDLLDPVHKLASQQCSQVWEGLTRAISLLHLGYVEPACDGALQRWRRDALAPAPYR
jgi:hypothetical protein